MMNLARRPPVHRSGHRLFLTALMLGAVACSSNSGGTSTGTGGAGTGGGTTTGTGGGTTTSTGGSGPIGTGGGTTTGTGGGTTTGTGGNTTTGTGGSSAGGSTGSATGGSAGSSVGATGGAGGSIVSPSPCPVSIIGTASRPQLTDASAACFTIQRYLAEAGTLGATVRDNWDPTAGLPAASTFTPTFTVAADGSGTHTTVQAAVTAAKTAGGSARAYILVKPGTYRELVCVDGSAPITLYGANTDATQVTIAFDNYNSKTVDPTHVNACAVPTAATYGTSGSTTFAVKSAGFQALNLTIANDFAEGTLTTGLQAVALTTLGDKAILQNVRLLGNQDTLQVKSAANGTVSRAYFKNSYIEGDTDFIFGRATVVFDGCTINYVAGRKTNSTHISPSTETQNPFGFLVINSHITGAASIVGTAFLGRAWDDSSALAPNGQAIIRETSIGSHVNVATPWTSAATTARAFSATGNRLYEYKNTGPGAAP